jgi:hypothetical protein
VRGTDKEEELVEAVLFFTPDPNTRGLQREGFDWTWVEGSDHWEVEVSYVLTIVNVSGINGTPPAVGTAVKRFTTAGERRNIKSGLELIQRRVPDPDGVPPFPAIQTPATEYVLIGDTGDPKKEAKGTDIIMPVHSFAWDFTIPASAGAGLPQATEAYEQSIRDLVGKKNDAVWKNYPAGSVLFTGLQGTIEYGVQTTLSFEFGYIPEESLTLGAQSFTKRGWDYLDVHGAKREVDPDTKRLFTRIEQLDIWEVIPDGDFTLLGIP